MIYTTNITENKKIIGSCQYLPGKHVINFSIPLWFYKSKQTIQPFKFCVAAPYVVAQQCGYDKSLAKNLQQCKLIQNQSKCVINLKSCWQHSHVLLRVSSLQTLFCTRDMYALYSVAITPYNASKHCLKYLIPYQEYYVTNLCGVYFSVYKVFFSYRNNV